MTHIEPNLLTEALKQRCLELFLAGEEPCFYAAKTENKEPQNIRLAFDTLVFPYWLAHHDARFPEAFTTALFSLFMRYPDRNRAIYVAHGWI